MLRKSTSRAITSAIIAAAGTSIITPIGQPRVVLDVVAGHLVFYFRR